VSGESQGNDIDLGAVNGAPIDGGVAQGALLVAFTEAVIAADSGAMLAARDNLRASLDDDAFVDTCAVIGAFNVVTRIADAIGIPLDDMMLAISDETRGELGLNQFDGARNTPAVQTG